MAKVVKTPKKGFFYEFRHLKSYHWNRLGIGVRIFANLVRSLEDKQELR